MIFLKRIFMFDKSNIEKQLSFCILPKRDFSKKQIKRLFLDKSKTIIPNFRLLKSESKEKSVLATESKENNVRKDLPLEIPAPPSPPVKSVSKPDVPIKWFSDPYHLSRDIKKLISKAKYDEAISIMERHTGASNAVVFGTLMSELCKAGEAARILPLYKLVMIFLMKW